MCWNATPDSILSLLAGEWAHHDEIKDQAVMLQGGAPDPEKIHGIHYWRHESPLAASPTACQPSNPPCRRLGTLSSKLAPAAICRSSGGAREAVSVRLDLLPPTAATGVKSIDSPANHHRR